MTRVSITLAIDASKKSFVLDMSVNIIPAGSLSLSRSRVLSISLMTSLAFEPAVWAIIAFAPGCPLVSLIIA